MNDLNAIKSRFEEELLFYKIENNMLKENLNTCRVSSERKNSELDQLKQTVEELRVLKEKNEMELSSIDPIKENFKSVTHFKINFLLLN